MLTSLPNGATFEPWTSTERFTELMARPEPEIALDEAVLAHRRARARRSRRRRAARATRHARGARRRPARPVSCRRCCSCRGIPRQRVRLRRPAQLVPRRRARPPSRHPHHAQRRDARGGAPVRARSCTASACPGTSSWVAAPASGSTPSTRARASTWPHARSCFAQPARRHPLPRAVPDAGRAAGDRAAHARQPPAHVHAAGAEGRGVGDPAAVARARHHAEPARRPRRAARAARSVLRGGRASSTCSRDCCRARAASRPRGRGSEPAGARQLSTSDR